MIKSILLILVLTFIQQILSDPHLLPVSAVHQARADNVDGQFCNRLISGHDLKLYPHGDSIDFVSPHATKSEVNGFFCQGIKAITKCSENYLWSKTVTHHQVPFTPSPQDCLIEINKIETHGSTPLSYPDPNCVWGDESDAEYTHFEITPHSVKFNPYHSRLYDRTFVGGECGAEFCLTHYSNLVWITKNLDYRTCPDVGIIKAVLYTKTAGMGKDKVDAIIESETIGTHKLSDCCLVDDFCNRSAIIIPNHRILIINPTMSSHHSFFELNLKNCPTQSSYNYYAVEDQLEGSELSILHKYKWDKCLEIVQKIQRNETVTRREISQLTPSYPGEQQSITFVDGGKFKVDTWNFQFINKYRVNCFNYTQCQIILSGKYSSSVVKLLPCTPVKSLEDHRTNSTFRGCEWYAGRYLYKDQLITDITVNVLSDELLIWNRGHRFHLNYLIDRQASSTSFGSPALIQNDPETKKAYNKSFDWGFLTSLSSIPVFIKSCLLIALIILILLVLLKLLTYIIKRSNRRPSKNSVDRHFTDQFHELLETRA